MSAIAMLRQLQGSAQIVHFDDMISDDVVLIFELVTDGRTTVVGGCDRFLVAGYCSARDSRP